MNDKMSRNCPYIIDIIKESYFILVVPVLVVKVLFKQSRAILSKNSMIPIIFHSDIS